MVSSLTRHSVIPNKAGTARVWQSARVRQAEPMASKTKRANPSRSRVKVSPGAVEPAEIDALDRWFRAANYLSVGQIYLLNNPLLKRPLVSSDIKPRLLGHWGPHRA